MFSSVITKGLGKMPPYGPLVRPGERWAVVAYVRALQLSQNAPAEAVPPERRGGVGASPILPSPPMRQP